MFRVEGHVQQPRRNYVQGDTGKQILQQYTGFGVYGFVPASSESLPLVSKSSCLGLDAPKPL